MSIYKFDIALGQILRSTHFVDFFSAHKRTFSRIQHWTLNAVLWNTFCNSFSQGMSIDATQTFTLIILLSVIHLLSLKGLFELFQHSFFQLRKDQVVASMFCASHKTLAFGLPLIKTIFEGNAELASYCAPVMLIHPIQLFLGSLLAPRIRDKYVQAD
jgi:sodium/bile acid cotransporter 7